MLETCQHNANCDAISASIDAVARFVGQAPIVSATVSPDKKASAALWKHSPKTRTFEGHQCDILAVSLRGDATLEQIDGGRCVWSGPAPGSSVLLRSREPTDWNLTGGFEMLHVYLPVSSSIALGSALLDRPFRDPILLQLARSTALALTESCGSGSYIAPLIESMQRYFSDHYLARITTAPPAGGGLTGFAQRTVAKFVRENLHRDIAIEDLARTCDLSPSQFTRNFKQSFGFTPHEFLIEQRIGRAAEMLCASGLRVEEVAKACGFSSASHLGAQFKQRMGVTPGNYRKVR
ncbi:helix-turn-helix domain-containing protein [Erythrobacter sp.]|uniref:helix-turn-helix domain-containing protein n=1 Tax=Erythrobacter sp. TaxID=1042 RepID=UPI003C7626D4